MNTGAIEYAHKTPAYGPTVTTTPIATATALAAVLLLGAGPAVDTAGAAERDAKRPRVEETTFKSVDATISAQWEFPAVTPAPLVVILPATSGVDRHGLPPGHSDRPEIGIYNQLAKRMVEAGFAVFRYDNAGTGKSGRGHYSTDRSTSLEAYVRAVDHARVDTDHVFLFGHSGSTSAIAGIYPRYESVKRPAGVILLSNRVGETEAMRIAAPTLLIVSEALPDDQYQRGRFVKEARDRHTEAELATDLVTIGDCDHALLTSVERSRGKVYSIHKKAVDAILTWLRKLGHVGQVS